MPSCCGTRPGMPLQHARRWGWWTRRPPCGISSGTSSSGGTLRSPRSPWPARIAWYTHWSGTRSGSSAPIAVRAQRIGCARHVARPCTSRALGPPMMWSRSWPMTRRTWGRSFCYPYPWDQCEPWWDNRVGWIPNCEDAAHPPTHPTRTSTHTKPMVHLHISVGRVLRVLDWWLSTCPRSHTAFGPQRRARHVRPTCLGLFRLVCRGHTGHFPWLWS